MPRSRRRGRRVPPQDHASIDNAIPQQNVGELLLPAGLPLEMWLEIVNWCKVTPGNRSLKSLCLTSKVLCGVVQPVLLAEICLGSPVVLVNKRRAQLKSLATEDCRASRCARILIIDYFGSFKHDPGQVISPMELSMRQYLESAIRSFKTLERVEWFPRKEEPSWIQQTIMESLQFIRPKELSIEWLEAQFYGIRSLTTSFETLLENLIPQVPHLRRLEINAHDVNLFKMIPSTNPEEAIIFSKIEHLGLMSTTLSPENLHIMLRHLPSLKSLCLRNMLHRGSYRQPDPKPPIWDIFKNAKVHLLDITTDTWTDNQLISYIDSYRGLNHIVLEIFTQNSTTRFSLLELLTSIAKNHAHSLVKLGIRADPHQRNWTWQEFTDEAKEMLLRLTNLQILEISISSESPLKYAITSLLSFFENAPAPSLRQLILVTPYFGYVHYNHGRPHFSHQHSIVGLSAYTEVPSTQEMIQIIADYRGSHAMSSTGMPPQTVIVGHVEFTRHVHPQLGTWMFTEVED